ncbi:MAG TPA: GHMP kinase [Acidobacteriota bacterium]|nr:GHMP kinase [Acidobacteriota bacterium]
MRIVRTTAHARAGLLGNPSDGYYGRTISIIIRNFSARVVLYEWPELEIILTRQDRCIFDRLSDLVQDVKLNGLYGGLRLVKAAIKRFTEYCAEQGIYLHGQNFSLRYDSDIPRQVGLAGSSAIVTATIRALMEFYGVSISNEILPNLVLSVETKEVGIAAGLQDRVVQTYEGVVFMDFQREHMERYGHGRYEPLDPTRLPPLFVAYRTDLSEISGVVHSNYRARWEAGDPVLVAGMRRLSEIALEGKNCLATGDWGRLGELINENFDTRAQMTKLDPRNVEMVMLARRLGAPAHYAGSGGSILGMYRDQEHLDLLRASFASLGCNLIKPVIL